MKLLRFSWNKTFEIQLRWNLLQEENVQPSRGTRPELHRLHRPLWNPGEREGSSQRGILLHILPNAGGHLPRHHLRGGLRPGQHHQEEETGKRSDLPREGRGGAELCGSVHRRPVHLLLPHLHPSSKYGPSPPLWFQPLRKSGNICFFPERFIFWVFPLPFLLPLHNLLVVIVIESSLLPDFGFALEKVPQLAQGSEASPILAGQPWKALWFTFIGFDSPLLVDSPLSFLVHHYQCLF